MRLLFYSKAPPPVPAGWHSKSHSAGLTALLLHSAPCGVDLELVKTRPFSAARCYPPAERGLGLAGQYLVWTRKEALYKLLCREGGAPSFREVLRAPVFAGALAETVDGVRYRTRRVRRGGQTYIVSAAFRAQPRSAPEGRE